VINTFEVTSHTKSGLIFGLSYVLNVFFYFLIILAIDRTQNNYDPEIHEEHFLHIFSQSH